MIEEEHGLKFKLQELFSNLRQGTLHLGRLIVRKVRAKDVQVDNSILVDTIDENTSGSGTTIEDVLLKDGVVAIGDVAFDDATSDPLIDGTAADGTENSVARKDHVHPKHHTQAHGKADHTEHANWKALYTDGSGDEQEVAVGADGTVFTGTGAASAPAFEAASAHAHANDHAQAHGPSDHTSFANWKVIHTDGSGDQQEVAVGADGTVFTGTGAASAPAFEAADEHAHANDHAQAHGPGEHTTGNAWKMVYQDASGDEQEIAVGADGQVLTGTGAASAPAFEEAGQTEDAGCTQVLTLTTSNQDVVGATITLPTASTWEITGTFDLDHSGGAGGGIALGVLDVDGSPETPLAMLHQTAVRGTVSQTWHVTTASADIVAKLQARKTVDGGTVVCNASHTTITASTGIGGGSGGVAAHAILDGDVHDDSVADAVTRGSLIYGNATPKWDELVVGAANTVLWTDGTDVSWSAAPRLANIADTGGTNRITLAAASPNVVVTGDFQVSGHVGLAGSTVHAQRVVTISPTVANVTAWVGIDINPTLTLSGNSRTVTAVGGQAVAKLPTGSTGHALRGLQFTIIARTEDVSAGVQTLCGVQGTASGVAIGTAAGGTLTVTNAYGLLAELSTAEYDFGVAPSVVFTNGYGVYVKSQTGTGEITNYYGLAIEDYTIAATKNYLVEVGGTLGTLPYFRVVGNVTAVSRETPVYISWGTAAPAWNLKQLKTVLESTLDTAAGTKEICYLV